MRFGTLDSMCPTLLFTVSVGLASCGGPTADVSIEVDQALLDSAMYYAELATDVDQGHGGDTEMSTGARHPNSKAEASHIPSRDADASHTPSHNSDDPDSLASSKPRRDSVPTWEETTAWLMSKLNLFANKVGEENTKFYDYQVTNTEFKWKTRYMGESRFISNMESQYTVQFSKIEYVSGENIGSSFPCITHKRPGEDDRLSKVVGFLPRNLPLEEDIYERIANAIMHLSNLAKREAALEKF